MESKSAKKPKRPWRISIRWAVIVLTLVSIGLAVWTRLVRPARIEAKVMAWVGKQDCQFKTSWKGPSFLDRSGYRFAVFDRIVQVDLEGAEKISTENLQSLSELSELRSLTLPGSLVDDKFQQLKQIKLEKLILHDTHLNLEELQTLAKGQRSEFLDQIVPIEEIVSLRRTWDTSTVLTRNQVNVVGPFEFSSSGKPIKSLPDVKLMIDGCVSLKGPCAVELSDRSNTVSSNALLIEREAQFSIGDDSNLEAANGLYLWLDARAEIGKGSKVKLDSLLVESQSHLAIKDDVEVWTEIARLGSGSLDVGDDVAMKIAGEFLIKSGALSLGDGSVIKGKTLLLRDGSLEMKGGNLRIEKLMEIDSRSQVEVTIEEPLPEGYVSVAEGPLKIQGGLLRVVPNGSVDLTAGRHEFLFAQAKWIKGEFDTVEFPKGEAKWDIQYKQDRIILVAVVED